jgi:glycosyltransferase involved in cell wall biosynthesis
MSAIAQTLQESSTRRKRPEPKKRLRIVHLTSVHNPFDGRIFYKECTSIARAGYAVTLIARHDRDEFVNEIQVKSVPIVRGRFERMLKTSWAIYREALRQNADLYHFHDPELIPAGLLLRLKKKLVVYDVHEDVPADVSAKHYLPKPLRRPIGWLAGVIERAASRYFSGVVAATSEIGRRFRFRVVNTAVIRNYPSSVAGPVLLRPWQERKPLIVYAGVLCADRCIGEMVEAMSLLPSDFLATLRIVGKPSPASYVRDISSRAGWGSVDYLSFIKPPEVTRLLNDARIGMCLCRPTPGYLESAPTKLFEYMQAGIPVIASDFPAFRAIVDQSRCGLLVNPADTRAIADAIEYLLTHSEEAQQMGERGQQAVAQTFNWETEERNLLDLYDRLLSHPAC